VALAPLPPAAGLIAPPAAGLIAEPLADGDVETSGVVGVQETASPIDREAKVATAALRLKRDKDVMRLPSVEKIYRVCRKHRTA